MEYIAQTNASLIHEAEKLVPDVVKSACKAEIDVSGAFTIDASYTAN